ncbi:MAG TPA: glycosyltransferase family 4 protein [Herpetosiphonaceae bacterium]
MPQRLIPVLQLVDGFATEEQSGGASQFGIQLARHLDRSRYAPFVCGLWRYGTASERRWREQLHAEGIGTAILIEQRGRLSTDLLRAAALLGLLLDRVRPLVLNSHFERGDLLCLWSKLSHPTHPRIVRTMHTDQQWQRRPWLGQLLNLAALPWIFDAEVAISEATRRVMDARPAARLARRRAVLLYNGISRKLVERLSAASMVAAPRGSSRPRIVIVGRLEQQKGHVCFLQAAAELLRDVPDAELWIVGTGSLLDDLQALTATLGIADAVRFCGQRSDVAEILLSSDLLVSSSLWEGFPTVILEAMAARVPVVATDIPGSRELVRSGATGLLVPVGQPRALAAAIRRLLDQRDEARRMAENAWREVQRYTLEHTASGYDRLYQTLIGVKR